MCSIGTNSTANAQLKSVGSGEKPLENKLSHWAEDSRVDRSGFLDLPMHHLHGLPDNLKHIRRVRTGRHRAFYIGHHSQCSYTVFYLKTFKKKGEKEELDKHFQRELVAALSDRSKGRVIREPDEEPKKT